MSVNLITTEPFDGVHLLEVRGEVDLSTSPELRMNLVKWFEEGDKKVIVDLSGVEYIDSSGIATLVEGLQWSHKSRGRFLLAGLRPVVKDIFEMTGLLKVFEIYETKDEAFIGIGV